MAPAFHSLQHICSQIIVLSLLLQPFNGLFSRTAWVSQYQKGKTSLDLNEARDGGFWNGSGISYADFTQTKYD